MSRAAAKTTPTGSRSGAADTPVEYSLLLTCTLCLLALGAVMVFSASSTASVLDPGSGLALLQRTLAVGAFGLVVMGILSRYGLDLVRRGTPLILAISFAMLIAVLIPGIGNEVNGARRWIGAGALQIQPSEVAKLAILLYGAQLLAARPHLVRNLRSLAQPFLLVAALMSLLVVIEPDLGTTMVLAFAVGAMLIAAGVPMRTMGVLAAIILALAVAAVIIEPYRMARVTTFLDPSADAGGAGFQATQARIALGSGGLFGVGIGASVQKAFYLPEAHTDMIFAVLGEEWGLVGVALVVGLFAVFGFAGLQIARNAADSYRKLLACGLTSLILIQAILNFFAVMGMAPLTGIPLPFVSYGNSSLLVMLASVGLLLNIARTAHAPSPATAAGPAAAAAARLAAVGTRAPRRAPAPRPQPVGSKDTAHGTSGDSRGGNSRARGARAGSRRRLAG
ncbi:MAG: putative lipid II flippase FtsW [Solirubrobacterales bacterium]